MQNHILFAAPFSDKDVTHVAKLLLAEKPLTKEEQKLFAKVSFNHSEKIRNQLVAVKFSSEGETLARAKKGLKILNLARASRSDVNICGATVAWYLFFEKKKVSSIPLIIRVDKKSPADKSGLLPGDVIDSCAGLELKSESSRNKFAQFMHQWPSKEPVELKVRRAEMAYAFDNHTKNIKKTLILTKK